jgi:tripartite-type tricarboxylate transporter receptor subunit TctC
MNPIRRILASVAALLALAPLAHAQPASGYPNRLVRVVVPFPAGGSADVLARIVAERLSARWGQTVVVENRIGAGGNIGAEAVYRADPDGYTILSSPPGPLAINHNLYQTLPFDPNRFVPVTVLALVPNVLTTKLELPVSSLLELIAYAKANPGKVAYASQGNGSTSHLSASMLQSVAGLDLVHIPYKGEGPALVDIVAGRVDIFFGNLAAALKFQQAGRVKILAIAHSRRSAVLPEVPTFEEAGVPGILSSAWFGFVLPPGTPAAIAERINATAVEVLRSPDVQKRFLEQGAEPIGNSTAEMAAFVKEEMARWKQVIQQANVKLN